MKQERKKQIRLYLVKQLSRLTIWLKNKDKEPESSVISLAPKVLSKEDDLKIIQPYLNELERSLKEEGITNIAVTGAYGSGKSTIIKTFQKNHCEYEYLNVSLASFTDNDENGKKKNSKPKVNGEENPIEPDKFNTNLERRLEISILQQLFYHVKPSEIPDSRFKRINNNKWWKLLLSSVGLIFWLISILLLFKFNYVNKINPSTWHTSLRFDWFAFISIVFFFTGVGFFAKYFIRLFSNSKINKLSIKGELELGDNVDKSVFNEHLEEIIYFFERTPYNVIVIEDLDRFDTTDIFTKLRELNILLNTSKLISREINFIYAVKDELFTDKNERVKFFDYIIPIIPFINASNAGVKLHDLIVTRNLESVLSPDFVQDIVSFIDDIDMRLLTNIFHEFCIYRKNIPAEIPDNLFAMIVFKNMYPDDFGKLSKREGDLYSFIANKSTYVKDLTDNIDLVIAKYKKQIEIINKESIISEKELRAVYINAIHELLPNALYLSNEEIPFSRLNNDELFEKIKNTENISFFYKDDSYNRVQYSRSSGISFSQIEAYVNPNYSYDERLQNITDKKNNKVEKLKNEIEILLNKKKEIEAWSLKEIFQEVDIDQHLGCFSNNQMMRSLLINGYLNEDYEDYISLFHEGNITRADDTFKRKVKSGIVSPFNYQLSDKVVNLVKEIPDKYFKRSVILNFDLVDFLAENYNQHKSKYDDIITILSNEKDSSVSFIEEYIERGKNLPLFIKSICNSWENWWDYINEEDPNNPLAKGFYYSDDRLEKYLKLIIEYAELDDIVRLNKNKDLQKFINRTPGFIFLIDKSFENKAQKVLEKLEIKLEVLCLPYKDTKALFDYIYENHYYQINANNISLLLRHHIENIEEQKIAESNYSTIQNSGCKHLIDYVEDNIGFYTKNVFLKLENNTKENEKSIIKLLNKGELSIITKADIIIKQEIAITNLSEIKEIEVRKMLIEKNQIDITWINLYRYYEILETGSDLDEVLINYLNQENSYNQLSKQTIKEELKELSEEVIKAFSLKVINCNELRFESYVKLLVATSYIWSSLSFEKLDKDKVEWLVNYTFLSLSVSNFNKLKENFPNEHIKLIEKQQEKLFSVWDEISLSEEDILLLLKSSEIINSNKLEIIKRIDDNYISGNKKIAKETCDLLANSALIELNLDVLESLISSSSSEENKIKTLNKYVAELTNSQFQTLVEMLGGDYPELFKKQYKPKFPNTGYNSTLFDNLIKRGLIIKYELYKDNRLKVFANY